MQPAGLGHRRAHQAVRRLRRARVRRGVALGAGRRTGRRRPTTTTTTSTTTTTTTTPTSTSSTHDRHDLDNRRDVDLGNGRLMRVGRVALLLVMTVIVQVALFPHLRLAGRVPDLGLVVAVAVAFDHGPEAGAIVGFLAGLGFDLFLETPLGLTALAYALTAYAVGVLQGGVLRTPRWFTPVIGVRGGARRRPALRRRRAAGRRRRRPRQPRVRHRRARVRLRRAARPVRVPRDRGVCSREPRPTRRPSRDGRRFVDPCG